MLTEDSLAVRKIARRVNERVYGFDRFVDIGVILRVIRQDPAGPVQLDSGLRARVLREHRWGGVVDTKSTRPSIVGPSRSPRLWLCSEDQEPIIMHRDADPRGMLVIGSEGAGKTSALAIWHHRRWVENLGEFREGGQTAPTLNRLGLVKSEIIKLWGGSWCRYADRDDFKGFELCDGSRIRFVSTHRQSAAAGSPVQGFNWSWAGRDEMQDQIEVHNDIESRGRAARDGGGYYKQLGTATAKDDPEWRTLRDQLVEGGKWARHVLLIERSPFVSPTFLADKRKSGITDREYRRRFLAEDVPPESRLYFNWSREHNLRPLPLLGARKITSLVLSRKTGNRNHALLIGHDPGTAKAASVFLDAYQLAGDPDVSWWVRGELFTTHQTAEQHAIAMLERARSYGCNLGREEIAHVRAQPVGQSEDKPDLNIYRILSRVGLDVKAAEYRKDGTGTGQIRKDSRIEMVNRLLCDAMGKRRLFVECDDHRRPAAPKLVEAFEVMERDASGRAETERKDEHDKSDVPCALGYALWPWEKEGARDLRAAVRNGIR